MAMRFIPLALAGMAGAWVEKTYRWRAWYPNSRVGWSGLVSAQVVTGEQGFDENVFVPVVPVSVTAFVFENADQAGRWHGGEPVMPGAQFRTYVEFGGNSPENQYASDGFTVIGKDVLVWKLVMPEEPGKPSTTFTFPFRASWDDRGPKFVSLSETFHQGRQYRAIDTPETAATDGVDVRFIKPGANGLFTFMTNFLEPNMVTSFDIVSNDADSGAAQVKLAFAGRDLGGGELELSFQHGDIQESVVLKWRMSPIDWAMRVAELIQRIQTPGRIPHSLKDEIVNVIKQSPFGWMECHAPEGTQETPLMFTGDSEADVRVAFNEQEFFKFRAPHLPPS